jgi:hypothetical protein
MSGLILVAEECRLAAVAPLADVMGQTRYDNFCQLSQEASAWHVRSSVKR